MFLEKKKFKRTLKVTFDSSYNLAYDRSHLLLNKSSWKHCLFLHINKNCYEDLSNTQNLVAPQPPVQKLQVGVF